MARKNGKHRAPEKVRTVPVLDEFTTHLQDLACRIRHVDIRKVIING